MSAQYGKANHSVNGLIRLMELGNTQLEQNKASNKALKNNSVRIISV